MASVPAIAESGGPIGSGQSLLPTEAQLECISEQEVVAAQRAWGEGIVNIGKVYSDGGDYEKAAADHINRFYAYDQSLVLFKPTLASVEQFRPSFDGALSYFVGGKESYPEDKGFAIRPWSKVRWQNAGITNNVCHMAVAMGNYYFTPAEGGDEALAVPMATPAAANDDGVDYAVSDDLSLDVSYLRQQDFEDNGPDEIGHAPVIGSNTCSG